MSPSPADRGPWPMRVSFEDFAMLIALLEAVSECLPFDDWVFSPRNPNI